MLSFDEACRSMRTGDVVLMHGTFPLSKVIQAIEGSRWTHSGVVIRPEDVGLPAGDVLFWESNSTPLVDVRFGTTKPGPMLVTLRDRVDDAVAGTYDMAFAWHALDAPRDEARIQAIWDLMPRVHDATFPSDLHMLLFWVLGRFFRERTPSTEIFCAELVAMTFQAAGWMSPDLVPNRFDPKDFSSAGSPPLEAGCGFSEQQRFGPPPAHP